MAFDPSKGGSSNLFQSFMGNSAAGGKSPVFGAFGMPQQQQQPDSFSGFGGRGGNRGFVGSGNGGVIGDWGPGGGQAPEMPIGDWGGNGGLAPEPRFDRPYGQAMDPMKPSPNPVGLPVQPMPRPAPMPDRLPVQPMPQPAPMPDRLPVQPMPNPNVSGLPVQPMPRTGGGVVGDWGSNGGLAPGGGAQGNSGLAEAVRGLQRHPTNGNLYTDQNGNLTTLQHFVSNYRPPASQGQQAQKPAQPSQAQLLAQQINQNALNRWNQR